MCYAHRSPPTYTGHWFVRSIDARRDGTLEFGRRRTRAWGFDVETIVYYTSHEAISDVASGLNFKRKGLRKLLDICTSG